jgi:hypothetical protein
MKKQFKIVLFIYLLVVKFCYSQLNPTLFIDSKPIKFSSDISLPYWVPAGKLVQLGQDAVSISIVEFNLSNSELQINQILNIVSSGTVPNGKVWKIEAIGIGNNSNYNTISNFSNSQTPSIFNSPIVFSTPGSYTWKVPPGVTTICIEVWGGGGNGGNSSQNYGGGAGGGGGYGYQCFEVISGTSYLIIVGGSSQSTSVGNLISATGGLNGQTQTANNSTGSGGIGGTSTAGYNINGQNGMSYDVNNNCPKGGNGGNGGLGGAAWNCPSGNTTINGNFPGGGGGGTLPTYSSWSNISGGTGANGQVKIYF